MIGTAALEAKLEHAFADTLLLNAALTHGSKQEAAIDYQRLEFLGDRVLSLVIAEELFRRFPEEKEGPLAARLSLLVREETCAKIGSDLQLDEYIRVGTVERRKGVQRIASVVGDVIEAIIGALYLDGGYVVAKRFVLRRWDGLLTQNPANLKDAKTFVQEWALGQALPLPSYEVQNREGPEHAPVFTIALQVGHFPPVHGRGGSKQMAEMEAAKAFLAREGLR